MFNQSHRRPGPIAAAALAVSGLGIADLAASPQFARQHGLDCAFCHVAPPRLTQEGEDFVARGYRLDGETVPRRRTLPLAVWNTFDVEHRASAGLTKAYPGRVEIISGGAVGRTRASYFVELRALSQQIGGGGRLLNRSGRFEDAFVSLPLDHRGSVVLTVGQFRALNQVDVSRRLSLSEPLAFAAGLPAPRPAATARLTGLRAFSPAGRQPALRLLYHPQQGPLAGELTLPFTDAASFELEARPKGVFAEVYRRAGLTSAGGHVFVGEGRSLASLVFTADPAPRWSVLASAGLDRVRGASAGRFSGGAEYLLWPPVVAGARLDQRTGAGRHPALAAYVNAHLPFGAPGLRQAVRLQVEQTLQRGNHRTAFALSHVF
jgi:hypothetical protein